MKKLLLSLILIASTFLVKAQTIETAPSGTNWVTVTINQNKLNTTTKEFMFYLAGQGWKSQISRPQLKASQDSLKTLFYYRHIVDSLLNLRVAASSKGQAGGVPSLDPNGFVPISQLDTSKIATPSDLSSKVDKVTGRALSQRNYTPTDSTKVAGLYQYTDAMADSRVVAGITGKEDKSNKVTALSGSSTDVQYPSAKVVFDLLATKQASGSYEPANSNIQEHISSTSNPHSTTKTQVGLGNVDNTSDASKPVSTLQQTALDLKVDKSGTKVLSDENYSSAEKTKLSGIAAGAEVNVNADWSAVSGDALILNKPDLSVYALKTYTVNGHALSGNVVVTKTDLSIDQVDNTSDVNKPVSTAQQNALNNKVDKITGKGLSANDFSDTYKSKVDGIASGAEVNVNADWNSTSGDSQILNKPDLSLKADLVAGKIPKNQIPAIAISETFTVNSQSEMLALSSAETGDIAVRNDLHKTFILAADPYSTLANWVLLQSPTDFVINVNGQNGTVTLTTDNINEGSSNKYFSQSLARGSLSFTAGSGGYNSTTGVISIPTNLSQLTNGPGYITGYTETDPVFSAWDKHTGISITKSQVSDFPTNLSQFTNGPGYITGYTETDPVFLAWNKSTGISITKSQISDMPTNLNQFINGPGFITGYTETDPVFTAWDKHTGISITKSQVSDFPSWSAAVSKPTYNTSEVTENPSYLYFTDARARSAQYTASSTVTGLLSSADWTTFNNKSNLSLGTTSTTAFRGDYGQTAYDDRFKWDGGSAGLNATTARSSLGLVIGTDVLAYRTFGSAANSATTDFRSSSWVPSWSDISGTVPTWNQSTTGSANYLDNFRGSEYLAYRSLLVVNNIDADAIFDNRREIYNLQTGNGSGNTHFPNNSTYGTFTVLGAGSFSTQIYSSTDNDLWFRTRYIAGSVNQWNHILSSVITDPLTTNKVIKWNGANAVNSLISDDGASVAFGGGIDLGSNYIGFNENGVRSWTMRINNGNLNMTSGDGSGSWKVLNTTASTSSTTGSLVVMGDVGFGGNVRMDFGKVIGHYQSGHANNGNQVNYFGSYIGGSFTGMKVLQIWNGSYNEESLQFSVHHGGVTSGTQLTIDKDGNTFIGYNSDPNVNDKFAVNGNAYVGGSITSTTIINASSRIASWGYDITSGYANYIGNWNTGNYWGIGSVASGNTVKIGIANDNGAWVGDANLLIGGSFTVGNGIYLGNGMARISGDGSGEIGLNYATSSIHSLVWYGGTTSAKASIDYNGNAILSGSLTASGGGFNSLRSLKNVLSVNGWKGSALEIINDPATVIEEWTYKGKNDLTLGPVIEKNSKLDVHLLTADKKAINTYSMMSLSIKGIQELTEMNNALKKRVTDLEKAVSGLIVTSNKRKLCGLN